MMVQSNDDVRLKVKQENVDKNPLSICQDRIKSMKSEKVNGNKLNIPFLSIEAYQTTSMFEVNEWSQMVMRYE